MKESSASSEVEPSPAGGRRLCWECQAELSGQPFCPACGRIQPQPPGQDYFQLFGLSRRLALDAMALERRFNQLSGQLEPARFQQTSSYEQELRREMADLLEAAYGTLRDPLGRVDYLLTLEGVRREPDPRSKQPAPPDLLDDVLELSEHLEALRSAHRSGTDPREVEELSYRLAKERDAFQQKVEAAREALLAQFPAWDALVDGRSRAEARRAQLGRMTEALGRYAYLQNLANIVRDELER